MGQSFFPWVAAATCASLCAVSAAQEQSPQYKLKRVVTGSAIPLDGAISKVAINRTYAQLADEEKALLRAQYENMGPDDEPPFPAKGMTPMLQAIQEAQRKLLVSGELYLIATVEPDGNVSSVKAIGSPSDEMVRFAASTMMFTKFKPALCAGVPCTLEYPLRYSFAVK